MQNKIQNRSETGTANTKVISVVFVFLATAYVFTSPYAPYFLSPLLKALPILVLLALSLVHLRGRFKVFTSLALAFSAIGDVLLALEFEHNFIAGLAAFLTAHLFYLFLFLPQRTVYKNVSKALSSALVLVYCVYVGSLIFPEDTILKVAVMVYMIVLCLMCCSAIYAVQQGIIFYALGALIFAVSDSIIAWDAFRQPLPYASIWIMTSYYMAQALIVLGIFQLSTAIARHEK